MTDIVYKKGDLFMGDESFIAHGCNAMGVMGAGFAAQIRDRFPGAYDYYRFLYVTSGLRLGEVYAYSEKGKTILHCITQVTYGRSGVHVSYDAIRDCMNEINYLYPGERVAMPQIGAGLAGGDWNEISKIIQEESTNFIPVVYVL